MLGKSPFPLSDDDSDEQVGLDVGEPGPVQRQQHRRQAGVGGEGDDVDVFHRSRVRHFHHA